MHKLYAYIYHVIGSVLGVDLCIWMNTYIHSCYVNVETVWQEVHIATYAI